jgi:hypothetical protein
VHLEILNSLKEKKQSIHWESNLPSCSVASQPSTLQVKVKATLQLTVSQSLYQGIEPILGLVTRYYFLSEGFPKFAFLSLWGALSDERSRLSFVFPSLVIYHYLHPTFTLNVFYISAIYIQ